MPSRPRLTGATACVLLVAASAVGRAISSAGTAAIWIAPDEPTYGMLGRSLWKTGSLTILGVESPFYGIVYPALAGLPLAAFGVWNGVRALQIVQPLVMSAAGIVVYAWARRLVSTRLALVAAALTIAAPALTYSGLLMTEVVFYPIAVLGLLALARALEEPTLERQALAVAAILLASLTRLQGLVLLPVLVTAVGLAATFERSTRLLRRFALALVLLLVAGAFLIAFHEAGASRDMLGAYTTTARASYQLGPAVRWIVWHAGDLFLLVAGLPLLAAAALVVEASRGRESSPAARALLAVTVSYTGWLLLQVGVFASRFSGFLLERNLVTVAPPLFIVFALWLQRGLPRSQPWTALACALVVAPALALPAERLADPAASPNSFTAFPFTHLREWTSLGWTRTIWIAGVIALALLFFASPRRRMWALPAVTLALLAGASAVASGDVNRLSTDLRGNLFDSADPRWVDRTAVAPVTYVYDGTAYWNGIWIHAFWNSHIDHVAALSAVPPQGALPPHTTVSTRFDGRLFTTEGHEIDDPYVLASERMTFVGTPVRSVTQPIDGSILTLWRVEAPARLSLLRTGFQPNGDFSGHAQIDVFACGPGRLEVTLLGKDGSPVTLSAPGIESQTVAPRPRLGLHVTIPAPSSADGNTRCTFSLDTPGLVGSTVISYAPTQS